jgi:hypothetical protein
MSNDHQIAKPASTVKTTLDHLELVERVPALTRDAARAERGLDERDYPSRVLILPHHPAVIAYVRECAAIKYPEGDLKTARRNLRAARVNYKDRVIYRMRHDICEWLDGGLFVSLSAIIEARAEALHWRKEILRMKAAAKIKQQQEQNRRSINRHRLHSMGLAS